MGTPVNRISPAAFKALKEPGFYADGQGLYLLISENRARSWIFRYRFGGSRRDMGLGSPPTIGLADARTSAANARKLLADKRDPIVERDRRVAATSEIPTFGAFADQVVKDLEPTWKIGTSAPTQWKRSVEQHCKPIRDLAIDVISTEHILKVIRPMWNRTRTSASSTRSRIEHVLDAAKVMGYRSGENPARWRGHLKLMLPTKKKVRIVHHPAMPYQEMPAFYDALGDRRAALAMKLLILTGLRKNEVVEAVWSEFDMGRRVWTIPPERMKMGKEHRVPLCQAVVDLLLMIPRRNSSDKVFWSSRSDGFIYPSALKNQIIRVCGHVDYTIHGMRSTFRDWVGNETDFPREIAEQALAHQDGSAVELAYRRGDMLAKRLVVMEAWAAYCLGGAVLEEEAAAA